MLLLLIFFLNLSFFFLHSLTSAFSFRLERKKRLARRPMPMVVQEMKRYSCSLLFMRVKTVSPSARTNKLAKKVKLVPEVVESVLNSRKITLLFREQVREGTKLI